MHNIFAIARYPFQYPGFCLKISSAVAGAIFIWEHVARTKNSNVKPSVGINALANALRTGFYAFGKGLSKISSFLTFIELRDLYKTAEDLFKPTIELVASPLESVKGYWETAKTYKYPIVVAFGTVSIAVATMYLWYLVGHRAPMLHFWPVTYLPLKY